MEGRRVGAKIEGFGNVLLMFMLQIQGKKELFFISLFLYLFKNLAKKQAGFNCTLDFSMTRTGEEPHPQSSQALTSVITHLEMLDPWRDSRLRVGEGW